MALNHSPRTVTNGLVLYLDAANVKSYPGSGTAWLDLSGQGNHGTLVNGPTFNSANLGSIVLDGTNDYINCGTNSSLKIDGGNFTIFSVCYLNTQTDTYGQFFYQSGDGNGDADGKSIFFSRYGTNTIRLDFYKASPASANFGTNSFASNTMLYLAVKYNRTTRATKFFRNGVFSAVVTSPINPSFTTLSSTQIGQRYTAGSVVATVDLAAKIYATMVYNRELSDDEIQQNFNALRGRYGI